MGKPADENTQLLNPDANKGWGPRVWQVVIAGTGFLTDAYDLFVIDLVLAILHRIDPSIGPHEKSIVASATLIGAVAGQLTFGLLGDYLGRRWTFLATCFLIVGGAVCSSLCVWTTTGFSLVYQLAVCRFALGFGVGGEYPLAATITAEGSDKESRGRMVAAVFSMQGWGMLLSCAFTLAFLAVDTPLELIWRLLLFIGAIPVALVIYFRAQMEETERFKRAHEDEAVAGGGEVSMLAHLSQAWRIIKCFWKQMVGTTMTWLILDITFYGTGSFKTRITGLLVETNARTVEGEVWHEATFAACIAMMAIPGYILSILFIDRIGRYRLQLGGFIAMAVNFFLLAYFLDRLSGSVRWLLIVFFGLTFLFSNFGPNTTTFVIPAEVYPTLIRSTCHGMSAAAGKIGAVIGAAAFAPMEHAYGLEVVLGCCGVTCVVGAFFTFFFTDDEVCDLDKLDEDLRVGDAAPMATKA